MSKFLYPVTNEYVKNGGGLFETAQRCVKVGEDLYPVTNKYITDEDFAFVIEGKKNFGLGYLPGEDLNFVIDWGDGTQSVVNSEDEAQREHVYATDGEWTITIKNYVSGWIDLWPFSHWVTRVLTPFPRSDTRKSFSMCSYGAQNLTSIPSGLFSKNKNVIDFSWCFALCNHLKELPDGLFDNHQKVEDFSYCFEGDHSLTGKAPALWNRTPTPAGEMCFFGCYSLSNYAAIPPAWKNIL
ncbi:hypothetical protein FACS189490_11640 [Clostridia bacterium]|nr:hypothetical protein FACS189490_11640 [Clostridia bacterium]